MKPIHHRESITVHAGPSVTIDTVAAQTSIAQTIAQAFGDNTMPPEPGSSGSLLSSPIHGAPRNAARGADRRDPPLRADFHQRLGGQPVRPAQRSGCTWQPWHAGDASGCAARHLVLGAGSEPAVSTP